MCRPRNITRHCGTLSQSRVQEQQQDLEEDVSTTATTGVPQSLPLLIGPIQVIPIADTLAIDFIPPPYFVVEVDDGIETLGWKEEEEEEIKNGIQERRVGTLWPLGLWSTSTSTSTTPTLCVKRYGSTRRTSSHNDWSAQMMQERKESNSAQLFVCALFFILTFLMTK